MRYFMLNKKKKYMLLDSILVSKDYKKNYGKK